ncbi:MAG: enoyl-CoA hydratase/isomerase family protein [Rhodobacteraceae bacterium]|nr:enoyl-CoA hydratase/isomerase family protein [Paracoccaceae bacterium]
MSVQLTTEGRIAIVTIDNPPVNALGQEVRAGLLDAAGQLDQMPEIAAVIVKCAGRSFVAGADIREFGKPPQPPHLPDVLLAIENARAPWIAAIHGTALGGGLELALACRFRIADPRARLGLPEVTLGLIPGAGGTVRLPRLVAAEDALEMIVTGKPVNATRAQAMGLIDALAEGDLSEFAKSFAQNLPDDPGPVLGRAPKTPGPEFEPRAEALIRRARGQNSPRAAVDALRAALSLPADQALARERAKFLALRDDPQSKALSHVFFAERQAGRLDRLKGVDAPELSDVGVVGGGTMGAGIAAACLLRGFTVTLLEQTHEAAKAARDRVEGILADSLTRGVLTPRSHAATLARFATATEARALARADLVIEAVFEDMGVKREVFARLDAACKSDAVLASNTSYLDINEIARAVADPARVVGLHFFSPAHVMKLLEIVVPDQVGDRALAMGAALAKRLGKIAVFAGVCDGFIANRIMSAYRAECERMLEAGALPWEIDAAMVEFGFPMGLFRMQDLAGLDIAWAMRKRRAAEGRQPADYVRIPDLLCEAGRLGQKTGRGWYLHQDGKALPDPEVTALIEAESARKGITRTRFSADQIMNRILTTIQAEGQAIVDEGIAARASDIDVVMINAFGFPRWSGGPMHLHDG